MYEYKICAKHLLHSSRSSSVTLHYMLRQMPYHSELDANCKHNVVCYRAALLKSGKGFHQSKAFICAFIFF